MFLDALDLKECRSIRGMNTFSKFKLIQLNSLGGSFY